MDGRVLALEDAFCGAVVAMHFVLRLQLNTLATVDALLGFG